MIYTFILLATANIGAKKTIIHFNPIKQIHYLFVCFFVYSLSQCTKILAKTHVLLFQCMKFCEAFLTLHISFIICQLNYWSFTISYLNYYTHKISISISISFLFFHSSRGSHFLSFQLQWLVHLQPTWTSFSSSTSTDLSDFHPLLHPQNKIEQKVN